MSDDILHIEMAQENAENTHDALFARIKELESANCDLRESLEDKRRLAREIDVAMHGEGGAAKQASLCDLVEPARRLAQIACNLHITLEDLLHAYKGVTDDNNAWPETMSGDDPDQIAERVLAENMPYYQTTSFSDTQHASKEG